MAARCILSNDQNLAHYWASVFDASPIMSQIWSNTQTEKSHASMSPEKWSPWPNRERTPVSLTVTPNDLWTKLSGGCTSAAVWWKQHQSSISIHIPQSGHVSSITPSYLSAYWSGYWSVLIFSTQIYSLQKLSQPQFPRTAHFTYRRSLESWDEVFFVYFINNARDPGWIVWFAQMLAILQVQGLCVERHSVN